MSINPSGLCQCGCGEATPIANNTASARGHIKGEPIRFIHGHNLKDMPRSAGWTEGFTPINLSGLCECGCGGAAPVANRNSPRLGHIRGEPVRFICGHHGRGVSRTGPASANWKGGRYVDKGYVWLKVGREHPMAKADGYALEHRLVMADAIGRSLRSEEVVHHLLPQEGGSGRKDDNRLENLRLFTSAADHMAHHATLRPPSTHCGRGHERTPENTYVSPKGQRACAVCRRAYQRQWRERKSTS